MGLRIEVRSLWSTSGPSEPARYEFDQPRVVIGRRRGADVILPHAAVSQLHATLEVEGTGCRLRDEGSTNGTRVNGQRIAPGRPKPLRPGDRVEIGGFAIELTQGLTSQATSTEDTRAIALRFLREARADDVPAPSLTVLNGVGAGTRIELPPAPSSVVIGRGDQADLQIDDADASRAHCEVARTFAGIVVRDLGSKNGVLVNRRRVHEEQALSDRQELTVGATVVLFEDPAAASLAEVWTVDDEELEELPSLPEPPAEPDVGGGAATGSPGGADGESSHGAAEAKANAGAQGGGDAGSDASSDAGSEPDPVGEVVSAAPERREGPRTDTLIYALAGSVLALSIAALVWLLSS